jgi:predicted nucleic acid-binding protein
VTLVDSSVWIDYFRGTPTVEVERLDALLGVEPILIGDLILTEVLQGFGSDADFEWKRANDILVGLAEFPM